MTEQNEPPLSKEFMDRMADQGRAGNLPNNPKDSPLSLSPERMDPIADQGKVKADEIDEEPVPEAEKEKLETVKKIGQSLADKLNNDLAVTGVLDMVIEDPSLSANHRALLEEVMIGMMRAGQRSSELMRMNRFRETTSPGGQPMLDWDKSLPQNPPKPNTPPKP